MLLRTEDKSQSPRNNIEFCNAEMFRYDDYVAISVFKLLSGWYCTAHDGPPDNKFFFLDRLVTYFSHGLLMSVRTSGNR